VVTTDHGEQLLEHGWVGHNVQLYDESMHVPLVVRFPPGKGPAGKRVSAFVDLLDVGPTIADLFGVLQAPAAKAFEGRSLLPVIAGAPGKPAVLSRTIWDRPRYALRTADEKFIYDSRSGEEMLLDLRADPQEGRDVKAQEPIRAAYYRQTLHTTIARLSRQGMGAGTVKPQMTCEECLNLKSLGYLGGDVDCGAHCR
jgi:arylsulfatase A-like enzyme